ncbi:ABC-type multidrug transport system, ATPase and permease component [Owenweeksia hongkongensis DSM 17368]|uniref:ABC-type multidrug transport system, ATPase and permease component n=1 Tax=Owenweeksia hongkongensis (strain DSM 17368 / CIP 108786 / JCM 12287 / NRRL B-23963 / UST20020801) TaxID=926562 RepID=G8R7G2_OWEHD|nr:ABC transporter ATP-binding protein [Owenweeksia hongkongensis]AEV31273.1 ABC-type multidrug transport system, ATPase and permease component [Owenweeksia hongkongensis DSM 17368]
MAKEKVKLKDRVSAFRNLPRFFKMIWHTSPGMTLGNVVLRIVKAAIPVIMLWVGKLIIDEIVFQIAQENKDFHNIWIYLAMELGLALFSDIINRGITLLDSLLGDLFSNETSVKLIHHAATLDLYQFEDSKFYDKLERARRQTNSRTALMSQTLTQLQDIITIIFFAVGLIAFKPLLIVILFIAIIPSFLGETTFSERSYSLTRSWTPQRRELDYLRYIGASDETAKEIKIFGLQDFISQRFKKLTEEYYKANKKLATSRAFWGSLLTAVGTVAYYGAYVYIVIDTVNGDISLGKLTFLAGSFLQMRNMLQSIMNRFSQIAESALYLQDLFDFFELRPQIIPKSSNPKIPDPILQGFTFENVSFKYPGSERYSLKHLNFHLKAGEKLALVGENGAGKTTLVKLLSRLYEPTEGRILLDGVDLSEYDIVDLRKNVSIIFQDFVKFQLKADENIAIGNINQLQKQDLIEDSADKSLANTVIDKLPERYQQFLGKRFEGGVELSGGEWQKIALARAYMGEAQLMILDEPTSALDARAENEVFIRFSELIAGRTAVLISHRFSTVRMADRILFLENGELLELGSHDQLLEKDGKYAALFKLQAKGYE